MKKLIQRMKEHQIDGKMFRDISSDVARYNLKTLRQVSTVGLIGGMLLVFLSLPFIHVLDLFEGYLAITCLFAVIVILTHTVLKKNEHWVLPVYYAFMVLILTIAIVMGTVLGRDTNATTFVMLIIVLPMLIIDRPYRLHLVFGIMAAIFCLVDYHIKTGQVRDLDMANCVVFYLLSAIISWQTINAKTSDIVVKRELKRQRDMDMLTKLSNRGAFERIVATYIHESNQNAIMLIMDLDNFKQVNDTMGHAYGDMVLKLVGEYLKEAFRLGDIVSRLGGDEFVAFLPAVGNIDIIIDRVNKLIARVASIKIESKTPCSIGASVGLAQYPEDGCSFEQLYKQADAALYCAKRQGKGSCVLYDEKIMGEVKPVQADTPSAL